MKNPPIKLRAVPRTARCLLPCPWCGVAAATLLSAPCQALLLQSPRVLWCCHQPQHVGNLLGLLLESQQTRAAPLESSGRVCGLGWDTSTCLGQRCCRALLWGSLCRQAGRHEGLEAPCPAHSIGCGCRGLGVAVPLGLTSALPPRRPWAAARGTTLTMHQRPRCAPLAGQWWAG